MASSVKGSKQLVQRLRAVAQAGTTEAILQRWQIRTVQLAKVHARKRSGALKMSIHIGERDAKHATVEVSAPYAADIEFGTAPHIIRPVNAKILAWGGARRLTGTLRAGAKPEHFAYIVHHPGTKPYPYLMPAAKQALSEADGVAPIVEAWNKGA